MVEIKIVVYTPEEIAAVAECLDTIATGRMATAIKSVVGEPTDRHASTAQHGVALEGSSNPVQSQPVASFSGDAAGSSEVAAGVSESADAPAAAAEQKRRGRKPKEAAAEPQKEPATSADAAPATTNETPAVQSASPSLDDARDALQAYSLKHGMPKAIELLGKFNAARISEVAEDRRAEFITEAKV